MTIDEAISLLKQYIDYNNPDVPDFYTMEEACKVVIKALEQDPCENVPDINDGNIYECSCGYGWDQSKVVRHHFCPNCGRAVDNLIKTELNRVKTELKPCEDAIRRSAVLEILNDAYFLKLDDGAALQESVNQLPSVTPQQKMGRWIDITVGDMPAQACDQCNTFYPLAYTGGGHKYCPNCGAKMQEAEE